MENKQTTLNGMSLEDNKPVNTKRQGLLALIGVSIVIIGFILHGLGFFTSEKKETNETSKNNMDGMTTVDANNTAFGKEKYTSLNADITPTKETDETLKNDLPISNLTGSDKPVRQTSNEYLNEGDYKALKNGKAPASIDPRKRAIKDKTQARLNGEKAVINYYSQDNAKVFQRSKSEQEELDYKKQERINNAKTAELMLKNLEDIQKKQAEGNFSQNYSQAPIKETVKEQPAIEQKPKEEEVKVLFDVTKNNTGRKAKNGFYKISVKDKSSYTELEAIEAVVHANADEAIRVGNGSVLKLRLLRPVNLQINGMPLYLPANTFINAQANIGNNRLMLTTSAIRVNNSIYPVNFQVYDLDGLIGLNIPELQTKAQTYQDLTQGVQQPFQGANVFSQGTVAQQVGTQVAAQTASQGIRVGTQLLQRKMQNITVLIKPNHKILLKNSNNNEN